MDTIPTSETIQGYADILAFQQSHPAERAAVEAELVSRLARDHLQIDDGDDTYDLCMGLIRDAGISTADLIRAICRQPASVWRPMMARLAVDAALADRRPSDAVSLQDLVDDALEHTAWRLDPRSPSRGIA